jgi:hypothetical protein
LTTLEITDNGDRVPTSLTAAALVLLFFFMHHNKHATVLLAHTPLAQNTMDASDSHDLHEHEGETTGMTAHLHIPLGLF